MVHPLMQKTLFLVRSTVKAPEEDRCVLYKHQERNGKRKYNGLQMENDVLKLFLKYHHIYRVAHEMSYH